MTRSHLRSRNLAAKRSLRPMKGRKKGDDEKNPISRFDPKAEAAVTRRGTDDGERIEGEAAAHEKKR